MTATYKNASPRICFVSKPSPQRYKSLDIELLSKNFKLIKHDYRYTPANFLQFSKILRTSDVVFSWFASPWMALARFLVPRRVKLIIVAGGYDVANCAELRHGARFHPIRSILTRHLLKQADVVLPVSKFNCRELLEFVQPKSHKMIYNAVDIREFSVLRDIHRPKKIITVGIIGSFISKCKGHFRFLEVASRLPEFEFVLMGKATDSTIEHLMRIAPGNVRIVDYKGRGNLIDELLSSSVYLQLSYYESFGVSVAEAIACGCYPIVSRKTALPEITCGMGEALDGSDLTSVVDSIKLAIQNEKHKKIDPALVRKMFSLVKREKKLVEIINYAWTKNT